MPLRGVSAGAPGGRPGLSKATPCYFSGSVANRAPASMPSRCGTKANLPHPNRLLAFAQAGAGEGTGNVGNSALDDAVAALEEQGVRFVFEDEEEEEDWDDILEDMDDPWMRDPAPLLDIEAHIEGLDAAKNAEPVPSPYSEEAGFKEITAQELRAIMSESSSDVPVVIDVRSSVEHSAGSIPGSVHIPLSQLTRESVSPFQGRSVVVLGSVDSRSRQAVVRMMRVFGFGGVRHFGGGVAEWSGTQ